jgi:Txe/YoeB family toxin of toxin-antitoxin system
MFKIVLTKQAEKDAVLVEHYGLKAKVTELLNIICVNPYQNPPECEKLKGYNDTYSRRLNRQHRFIYQVIPNSDNLKNENGQVYDGFIKIIRMWTHYE